MTFDIGPVLGGVISAAIPVVVLWIKSTRDSNRASSERAAATRGLHEKIDDTVAPVVGAALSPPAPPSAP